LDAAYRAGKLKESDATAVAPALATDLAAIRSELGLAVPDALLARGALVWTSIFGAISFEVFGQYGADTISARDELFRHHVDMLARVAGFD
ncbi:WHG domain-containing protein, partial [Clostridium perfringens]|uniref:WHG domain-containing protein n=1 Tax=Clostridium perfringens TaxID=1502 RepID=UPI0018E432FF